jgi:hypothetical protein
LSLSRYRLNHHGRGVGRSALGSHHANVSIAAVQPAPAVTPAAIPLARAVFILVTLDIIPR